MKILSPSILSADFGELNKTIEQLNRSEAQWIHIDVMDGVFVPNISFGFPILKAVRKATTKVLDTHLMIVNPEKYIDRFAEAGADILTIHFEATNDLIKSIDKIKSTGMKAGVSIKPGTNTKELFPYLEYLDLVLIMGVEPGFGGQKFIESSLNKVTELRKEIDSKDYNTLIEIDGGINLENINTMYETGCNAVVAGNAIFSQSDPIKTIHELLNA